MMWASLGSGGCRPTQAELGWSTRLRDQQIILFWSFYVTAYLSGCLVGCSCIYCFRWCQSACAQKAYKVEQRWTIGGDGSWDYMLADASTHRLYIAHQTRVDVVDTETGKVVGTIAGLTRCHGIVILPDGKTGFVSDGGANTVVVFDPATLAVKTKIAAGTNPDGMAYEASTNTLWAFNGGSKNATVIDAGTLAAVGTVALPGKPEFPVSDDAGTIYVNIEDKNAIVRLDVKARKATATWPLAGLRVAVGAGVR